ncbi:MAG: AAA family ATPase [Clostridia bacterium]
MAQKELNLINMEEVDAKAVDWLWYPFLPIGKISIVQGDPGEGKTTFILQVIALLTRGEKLPFDEQERSPMNVI